MLLRIILLVLMAWIAYQLIRKFIAPKISNKPKGQFEAMVSCSHCGLHLPQRDAVHKAGRYYCCQEHADSE